MGEMSAQPVPWTWGNRWLGYDGPRRRLWVCRQRIHHGAVGLIATSLGVLLVLHDWKDHAVWFARGVGEDR